MSALKMLKNIESNCPARHAVSRRSTGGRRRPANTALTLALGATLASACGAVAGPEYTGEVGLELRGEVTSLEEGQEDLVPALAFLGAEAIHLVHGEVTGEYPKQFTMRVDEAPPEAALLHRGLEGADFPANAPDRMGVAWLVLVAKDHPASLPYESLFEGLLDGAPLFPESSEPDPVTGEFTRRETACSADGEQCETHVYSCRTEECETVLTQDRPLSDGTIGQAGSGVHCQAGPCLTFSESCEDQTCSRTIKHCELKGRADMVSSEGTVDRCTLESRTGEAPNNDGVSRNFAQDLFVMFMSDAAEVEGIDFEKGYNVLRVVERDDKTAWAEALACRLDAQAEVMNNPGDRSPGELEARIDQLRDQCPPEVVYQRLANPSAHQLKISLGDPSPIF